MSKEYIPSAVQKALFHLSRGLCYAPECARPVLQVIDNVPVVVAEIAHICAEKSHEARYDPTMPQQERVSFGNVILLCPGHHKLIDRKPTAKNYSAELLRSWKKSREGDYEITLNGIGILTDERLQSLMADAITQTKSEILAAIDDLKTTNKDTVNLIRSLLIDSFKQPYSSNDIALLHEAAFRLGNLEDNATLLYNATYHLGNLEDNSSRLARAAEQLGDLEYTSGRLIAAVDRIQWHTLQEFISASSHEYTAMEQASMSSHDPALLEGLVNRVELAAKSLRESHVEANDTDEVTWLPNSYGWVWLKRGFFIGVAALFVAIALVALLVAQVNST